MASEGTLKNVALYKRGTKQYMATKHMLPHTCGRQKSGQINISDLMILYGIINITQNVLIFKYSF
jgi:hypothetical protein